MGPRSPREVPRLPPRGFSRIPDGQLWPAQVGAPQGGAVDQSRQEGAAVPPFAPVEELIDEALAPPAPVDQEVLERDEPVEVDPELRVAPGGEAPDVSPGEAEVLPGAPLFLAGLGHQLVEVAEEPPGLGR